jgi:hypothetical protein
MRSRKVPGTSRRSGIAGNHRLRSRRRSRHRSSCRHRIGRRSYRTRRSRGDRTCSRRWPRRSRRSRRCGYDGDSLSSLSSVARSVVRQSRGASLAAATREDRSGAGVTEAYSGFGRRPPQQGSLRPIRTRQRKRALYGSSTDRESGALRSSTSPVSCSTCARHAPCAQYGRPHCKPRSSACCPSAVRDMTVYRARSRGYTSPPEAEGPELWCAVAAARS